MPSKLLIVAVPRSASSFVIRTLIDATHVNECPPRETWRNFVPLTMVSDLYLKDWEDVKDENTIGKLHCRGGTTFNTTLLSYFAVKVVFLYRNLYDTVVSMVDHHNDEKVYPRTLWMYDWPRLTDWQKCSAIIDVYVPNFLYQYISWKRVHTPAFPIVSMTYDEVVDDPKTALCKILSHGKFEIPDNLEDCINKNFYTQNYNVGTKGRGKKVLDDSQQDRIKRMCQYYPDIDFSYLLGEL